MPWCRAYEGLKSDDARVIMDEGYGSEERARARARERGSEVGIDERTLNLMVPREINEEIVI